MFCLLGFLGNNLSLEVKKFCVWCCWS